MTAPSAATERELKLGVWPEFELPDLGRTIKGGEMRPPAERRLEAVYFDTPELRLLRRGVTLRFRRGEDSGPLWTAKLPAEAPALGLARHEISLPGRLGSVPALLRDLTRGWALGARLEPVARIVTTRRSVLLLDRDGDEQASIDDDAVAVLRGRNVAARFRELEVELAEGTQAKLLSSLAKRLRSVGAQPVPQVPKLVHALGPAATEPWDLAPPDVGPRPSAIEALRGRLVEAAGAGLVDHHAAIVLGEDAADVREAGRAARQLAADLHAFEPLLDADESRPLREGLAWLASELGRLEATDELIAGAGTDAGSSSGLVPGSGALDSLFSHLAGERARVRERLLATLRGRRYRELLAQLAAFAGEPKPGSAKARRPAATVVPALVSRALRDLPSAAEIEPVDGAAVQRLEWPVERLGSVVDVAAPLAGPAARRAAREIEELRQLLSDHRHALLGARVLRAAASGAGEEAAWTAGVVAGIHAERAAAGRTRLPRVLRHLNRKSRWTWLD